MASLRTKLFFFFLICSLLVQGQGVKVPFNPILFENTYALYNSSQASSVESIKAGTQNRFGAFSEIRQFYGFGNVAFGEQKSFGAGLIFSSEQEGQLIAENRLKAAFWKKIVLNEKVNLVASGQLGFINTSLGGTKSTSGANAWAPDIDFGLSFNLERTVFAASINQIGSPEISPLSQEVYFKNFYTLFVSHNLDLSPFLEMQFCANAYLYTTVPDAYYFKTNLAYNETFLGGVGLGTNGLVFSLGLRTKKILQEDLLLQLAYQNPAYSDLPSVYQTFQIHVGYVFRE